MGSRGPAREPDAVKLLRGETRPSRLNGMEPLPRLSLPTMPKDMDERARAVWRAVLRTMGDAGVITAVDGPVLRIYCEAVSRYEEAQRLYATSSPLLRDRGHLTKNPLHQVVRENADQVRVLARELGLSPAARANLRIEQGPGAGGDIDAHIGPPPRLRMVLGHR